jgi:hypothetical protein
MHLALGTPSCRAATALLLQTTLRYQPVLNTQKDCRRQPVHTNCAHVLATLAALHLAMPAAAQ